MMTFASTRSYHRRCSGIARCSSIVHSSVGQNSTLSSTRRKPYGIAMTKASLSTASKNQSGAVMIVYSSWSTRLTSPTASSIAGAAVACVEGGGGRVGWRHACQWRQRGCASQKVLVVVTRCNPFAGLRSPRDAPPSARAPTDQTPLYRLRRLRPTQSPKPVPQISSLDGGRGSRLAQHVQHVGSHGDESRHRGATAVERDAAHVDRRRAEEPTVRDRGRVRVRGRTRVRGRVRGRVEGLEG